jgi:hypothetical protein
MNKNQLSNEELDSILENLQIVHVDLQKFMDESYNEIMFLGTATKKIGGRLLDSLMVILPLCLHYYISMEEYSKADKLNRLYAILTDESEDFVPIDEDILKSIIIFLN